MNLPELFRKAGIDWTNFRVMADGGTGLSAEFEIEPKHFLSFAREDARSGDLRGRINSIGNSKRAIDAQIDVALTVIGYGDLSKTPPPLEWFIKD